MLAKKRKKISIVLLGKTGSGKSTTGNTILRRKAFISSSNADSATECCKLECSEFEDRLIRVVDTHGLMGTRMSNEEILQRVSNAMSLCPEGFNALVYVTIYGQRFTKEEIDTLELLTKLFGDQFLKKYCIVIMTKGDNFELSIEDKEDYYTFQDWLNEQTGPTEFITLLDTCKRKVVLFYNEGRMYKEQREKSLNEFLQLVESNKFPYTDNNFQACVMQRKTLIAELKCAAQTVYVQEQLSCIKQELQETVVLIKNKATGGDKYVIEARNNNVQGKLDSVENRLQKIITQLETDDDGTGVMDKLLKEVSNILKEVQEIRRLSEKEKIERIVSLELAVETIKSRDSGNIHHGFSVTKTLVGVGAVIGAAAGWATGLSTIAATTAVAATIAAPVIIFAAAGAGVGAGVAYVFCKLNRLK